MTVGRVWKGKGFLFYAVLLFQAVVNRDAVLFRELAETVFVSLKIGAFFVRVVVDGDAELTRGDTNALGFDRFEEFANRALVNRNADDAGDCRDDRVFRIQIFSEIFPLPRGGHPDRVSVDVF